jgi:hypothetical protein
MSVPSCRDPICPLARVGVSRVVRNSPHFHPTHPVTLGLRTQMSPELRYRTSFPGRGAISERGALQCCGVPIGPSTSSARNRTDAGIVPRPPFRMPLHCPQEIQNDELSADLLGAARAAENIFFAKQSHLAPTYIDRRPRV